MIRKLHEGEVVIVNAVRTPIGAIGGGLKDLQALQLATAAIKNLLEVTGLDPKLVQYTTFGWVMQDPRCPNMAKVAAEKAGVPPSVPGTTVHENCASGGAALHDVVRRILVGDVEVAIAGGAESMSNVARYLYSGRVKGQLYGDIKLEDGVMGALVDRNIGKKGELMGLLTERLAEKYAVTRQEQDEIAYRSHHNALAAWEGGFFKDYVFPVEIPQRKREPVVVARDEGPKPVSMEDLEKQKPYFKPEGGTITSMNASSINDAAAALLLCSSSRARQLGLKPLAAIRAYHNIGVPAEYMGEGAFKVIPGLLERGGVKLDALELFELNEAFAAVVGAAFHDIPGLEPARVNQWGSGISLGHPVGCTAARQVTDMVHQLHRREKKLGMTTRCVGGGMGGGEILERL